MSTFFKTFFICLIIALSFLGYQYFGKDGYSPDLSLSDNPIFSMQKNPDYNPPPDETLEVVTSLEEIGDKKNPPKKEPPKQVKKDSFKHTSYFYSQSGSLIAIEHENNVKDKLKGAILVLLKGPTIKESQRGIYSEIPANVDLISLTRKKNSIIINLSSNFGEGGGSEAIENRLKQLTKTVKSVESKVPIYLYLEGKKAEYLGGDGIYIKQPL